MLGLWAIYFLATINLRSLGLPVGEWPRVPFYVYTTSKITLTFDGKEITIEGTTRCRRRIDMDEDGDLRPLVFLDHIGFTYHCGPEWFGHRLADGSALLVGAFSLRSSLNPNSRWSSKLGFDAESVAERVNQLRPAVIWLDNADSPARADYYYSMAALHDPTSRLTAIAHRTEMQAASLWTSFFTGRSATDPTEWVPAASKGSRLYGFVGHYAIEVPKEAWTSIDALKGSLAGLSGPTVLRPQEQISEAQLLSLNKAVRGTVEWHPPHSVWNIAVAMPELSRSDSGGAVDLEGDEASIPFARPVLPEAPSFQVFHFDDDLPRGAVGMFARANGKMSDSVQFSIGSAVASAPYNVMWFGGYLFDPTDDTIYRLGVSTF